MTTSAATPAADLPPPRRRAARLASAPVILQAATTLFLRNGYVGTSVDDIAALAHVSKQTVYTHFADKQQLFAELIRGNFSRVDQFLETALTTLGDTDDLDADLRTFARQHVRAVLQPEAVQLRRLVIGEAGRFPELARGYYEQVPQRVIGAVTVQLQRLADRGVLRVPDASLAANHLAWLILGPPLDAVMLGGDSARHSADDLDRLADAAVDVFLAAYRPTPAGLRTKPARAPTHGNSYTRAPASSAGPSSSAKYAKPCHTNES